VKATDVGGIAGCGGFVEASSHLAKDVKSKLDLSSIKVKLTTLDGITKDHTDCAPNGYYFIPIYDKASFNLVVEGPKGWNFGPVLYPKSHHHISAHLSGTVQNRAM